CVHMYAIQPYLTTNMANILPALPKGVGYSLVETFLVMVILGVAVGAGGGAWTSGKYLKI
ncbi:MAG: hypothetical protein R3D26_09920, partial [Cyanobacteriota/Melainabacteria group bacterium]